MADEIILSVALKSGRFKTELRVPFPCDDETRDRALQAWFDVVHTGFKVGATEMDVVLASTPKDKADDCQP